MSLYLLVALLAGVGLAFQAVINARLGLALGGPIWAATAQGAVGLVFLLVCVALMRAPVPAAGAALQLPWWMWTGGVLGASYVVAAILVIRPLGAALMAGVIIVGQLTAALVIDHYGLFGVPVTRLTWLRVLGVILLFVGAVLIRWK